MLINNHMLTIDWPYQNEIVHSVDYDKDYYYGKLIDIGWDEYDSTVHCWHSKLNQLAANIYQQLAISVNQLKMNQTTFETLQLETNPYFTGSKLSHYSVTIEPQIANNQVHVYSKQGHWVGQLNIIK